MTQRLWWPPNLNILVRELTGKKLWFDMRTLCIYGIYMVNIFFSLLAGPNALESRIQTMIPSLPTGSVQHPQGVAPSSVHHTLDPRSQLPGETPPPVYIPPKPAAIKVLQQEGGTPTKDEGSSTPVLDEKEDSPPRTHQNPIDFLTQILSKTPKTSTPGSSFLQNLSLLTNTVKSQFQQNRDALKQPQPAVQPAVPETPNSWAEWKAQMNPEPMPQPVAPPLLRVSQPNQPSPSLQAPIFSQMSSMSSAPQPISAPAGTLVSPPVLSPPSAVRPPPLQAPPPNFIPQQKPSPEAWNPRPPIPSQPFPMQPNFSAPPVGGFSGGQGDGLSPNWTPQSAPNSERPSPGWNPQSGPPPEHSQPVWNQPNSGPPPGNNWNSARGKPDQNWSNQNDGSWNQPWDQNDNTSPSAEGPSTNASAHPLPPKGILRNRKSSLKEVPITPSESLEDSSHPLAPGEPPSPRDGKFRIGAKEKTNSAPDDHREFLEKLKKKTTGSAGGNLVAPPVVGENNEKNNLLNVPMNSENNNSVLGTGGGDQRGEEEEASVLKIETVRVERRYQSKHDDIRMPDKPHVNKDYRYEQEYERPERHDNGGYRDDYGPPYGGGRGPPGPRARHPGSYRGGRDPGYQDHPHWDRPGPPPQRHYHDHYNDYPRPYYY